LTSCGISSSSLSDAGSGAAAAGFLGGIAFERRILAPLEKMKVQKKWGHDCHKTKINEQ